MKQVVVTGHGGPECLSIEDGAAPEPGRNEVLVKVRAAGLNYADIMMRKGLYPGAPEPPFVAGFELAGVIEKTGPGVEGWRPGDGVMALASHTFAEYAVVPVERLLQKPNQVDYAHAAALPCQYLTAYHALKTLAGVQAGEHVLIHAAAGGLGVMLVQIAKQAGAIVIGTCSSEAKCELIRELGCDHPINYLEADFEEEVKAITGGEGVGLIAESVGGEVFDKSMRCLKTRGRLIVIGAASGDVRSISAVELLFGNHTVSGFHLFAYLEDDLAMANAMDDLYAWLASDVLRVTVGHTFPLDKATEAQELMAARKTSGKVVFEL